MLLARAKSAPAAITVIIVVAVAVDIAAVLRIAAVATGAIKPIWRVPEHHYGNRKW